MEWILHLLQSRKLRAVMLAPPCTSFSPAAHPCVRSYSQPEGFDRLRPKTWLGNCLAFMSFAIFLTAVRSGAAVMLENPRLSKMAWTRGWKFMRSLPCVEETWTWAPYWKEFRLLLFALDPSLIHWMLIEGQLTKKSAVYVPHRARGDDMSLPAGLESCPSLRSGLTTLFS